MGRVRVYVLVGAAGVAAMLFGAAARPQVLSLASPGLWELTGLPGAGPLRQCVADMATLARLEHRDKSCTQVVISDAPSTTTIHYTCVRGGFGQTKMTAITPRSLRIETQGISATLPFNYVIQARRVGNCPAQ